MNRFVGISGLIAAALVGGGAAHAGSGACSDRAACEKECEGGNAESCFQAAMKQYEKGADLKVVTENSRRLYDKACKGGHQKACARVASNLMFGPNKDRARAQSLLEAACRANDSEGCDRLGFYLDTGAFGAKDPTRAFPYFERACALGQAFDCRKIALALMDGNGVPADPKRGLTELEKSCAAGAVFNCLEIAKLFRTGDHGMKQDLGRALTSYTELCQNKHLSNACVVLGTMYRDGQGTKRDLAHAAVLYEDACQNHNNWGCVRLGELREQGVAGPKNVTEALSLYERACPPDKTYPAGGCYQQARLYERGASGVTRDDAKAAQFFGRACFPSDLSPDGERVNRVACAKAGPMLERAGDISKARYAYQTSCSAFKDPSACINAKRLSTPPKKPAAPAS